MAMAKLYGGVETGGTWCVCALGTGPEEIRAHEQFPTTTPEETLERIVAFFRAQPAPAAIGIGSFGPIDPHPASPTWGYVTTTPKPGWQRTPVAPVVRDELGYPSSSTPIRAPRQWASSDGARAAVTPASAT